MESSNPAFARRPEFSQAQPASYQNPYGQQPAGQQQYGGQPGTYAPPGGYQTDPNYGQPTGFQNQPHYGRRTQVDPSTDVMTIDDVVVKTGVLFAIMLVGAGATFFAARSNPGLVMLALFASIIATLGLGIAIAFSKTVRPALIMVYAAFEGVFVGAISWAYDTYFGDGTGSLVGMAVMATMSVFAGMLIAYRMNFIRATPKFTRILMMATFGYLIFALVNFAAVSIFHTTSVYQMGLLGIGISILGVGLASLNLVLDFDYVERGIANRLPEKYSWLAGYGLLVTLVWLYVEILRLLALLRGDD